MSFGEDVGAKPKSKQERKHAGRRLEEAETGERVTFIVRPRVKGKSGEWVEAWSMEGVVAYHIGGSPFVRFILADGRETAAVWVASSTPIEERKR